MLASVNNIDAPRIESAIRALEQLKVRALIIRNCSPAHRSLSSQ